MKRLFGLGIAGMLGLLPFSGGQALAQDGFFEPADAPADVIVVEPPEIVGLTEIAAGPLIIYGAYASVADVTADAPDVIVPLGEIIGVPLIEDIEVVITDAEASP